MFGLVGGITVAVARRARRRFGFRGRPDHESGQEFG
jgi:hypothetical protein